ncbi:hypothetical protein FNF29_02273 [Cafeteria roenbergensis]|uniref:N-acetylneuraminate lyase n=1 Tax=Cafeteria roenbergensis TaxID=33653 RepID=A0A5A8D8U7_CAFRO|nr:hypothetical protein FNF29_02273 [Cafeteria roenbergensis]KAA0161615.1 hypothetical protein FNF31_03729 [Cafeteria roenbergensis]KAA0171516.1 hypothetical protein FNF28_00726 [Cafeteria roenbergensis]|eukprot:KAA0154744.1 hypothetical protein FNF29_02273 [Cafeteria roenbergensis]
MDPAIAEFRVGEFAGATYSPFTDDGLSLNLDAIGPYAAFLASKGLHCVFINGTSGESMSLSEAERKAITERWVAEGAKQSPRIRVVAHIGCDSLTATCELARHAQEVGVDAISSMAPVMLKPTSAAELAGWLKHVCAAAPRTPFYYYHFPAITGIGVNPLSILRAVEAARIPQFRGFKFTDYSLFDYERCVTHAGGAYEICYGRDDALLGGIATGATSHIGNGFCFMIGPFKRIKAAVARGDLAAARKEQAMVNRVVEVMGDPAFGSGLAASKAMQALRGVPVGPVRLPIRALDAAAMTLLRARLDALGFFDWCD